MENVTKEMQLRLFRIRFKLEGKFKVRVRLHSNSANLNLNQIILLQQSLQLFHPANIPHYIQCHTRMSVGVITNHTPEIGETFTPTRQCVPNSIQLYFL